MNPNILSSTPKICNAQSVHHNASFRFASLYARSASESLHVLSQLRGADGGRMTKELVLDINRAI